MGARFGIESMRGMKISLGITGLSENLGCDNRTENLNCKPSNLIEQEEACECFDDKFSRRCFNRF